MKEIHIIWDKVTAHSRFWSIVIFIGIIPALSFYAGMKMRGYRDANIQVYQSSTQSLYEAENRAFVIPTLDTASSTVASTTTK